MKKLDAVLVTLLMSIFLFSPVIISEEYIDKSNPNLGLCKEFKHYLEKNADKHLYCGLVNDPAFSDFRLAAFEPAPEGLGLKLQMQYWAIKKKSLSIDAWKKRLTQLEKSAEESTYNITRIDLDHDGSIDNVLMHNRSQHCLSTGIPTANLYIYDDNEVLRQDFRDKFSYRLLNGVPFLYKGRVYTLKGGKFNYSISEPSRTLIDTVISRSDICRYLKKTS